MLSEKHEQDLDKEYELLNSEESKKYTKKVLLEMGKYIEQKYPGVDFELKLRFKSPESFKGKKDRMRELKEKDKPIYDIIGCCLVVKEVSKDFAFDHKLCRKYKKRISEIELQIINATANLKLLQNEYKTVMNDNVLKDEDRIREQIARLQNLNSTDELILETIETLKIALERIEKIRELAKRLMQEIENQNREIVNLQNELKETKENETNEMIATHIMNNLLTDKSFLNPLKLKKIPGRTKNHDGGKSGFYVAVHDAMGSDLLKYWKLEVKGQSGTNYEESKLDHPKAEGKGRNFPSITRDDFINLVLNTVPKNLVYQHGKFKNGKFIKEPSVYECSDVENVVYYYADILKGESTEKIFKYVVSNKELFSGKGKKVISSKKKGEIDEAFIQEDDMER